MVGLCLHDGLYGRYSVLRTSWRRFHVEDVLFPVVVRRLVGDLVAPLLDGLNDLLDNGGLVVGLDGGKGVG